MNFARSLLIIACCCYALLPSTTSAGNKSRPFRGSAEGIVTDLIIDPDTNELLDAPRAISTTFALKWLRTA